MPNYYQILGVAQDATKEEIHKAYKRLCLIFHPDKNNSPNAQYIFQQINEAHDALMNNNNKKQSQNKSFVDEWYKPTQNKNFMFTFNSNSNSNSSVKSYFYESTHIQNGNDYKSTVIKEYNNNGDVYRQIDKNINGLKTSWNNKMNQNKFKHII